ncbi:MAG: NDP-sugar synthase, partial [Bdellovibrionales bacterium]|nr:NDP-sugar synthase [Bdellovibrionales bacterium]
NLHHLHAELKSGIIKHAEPEYPIHFSDESESILGSAGAIKKAADLLTVNENFVLHNGDEVYFPLSDDLNNISASHSEEERLATILVMDHKDAGNKFGAVWVDKDNRVVGFGKKPFPDATPKHYIGTMILNARIIQHIPLKETNILYDTLTPLLKNEQVVAHNIDCKWFETGNEADYIGAHIDTFNQIDLLSKSNHFKNMLKKYLNISPDILKTSPLVFRQGEVSVDSSAELSGFVWLLPGAKIGAKAEVSNTVLGEGASILPNEKIFSKLVLL